MITIAKVRRPGLRGIFDFEALPAPKLPPMDLPLDAGSLSPDGGGADGGGEPAPAPSPGDGVPADFPGVEVPLNVPGFVPPPTYVFPVQEVPPAVVAPAPVHTGTSYGLPTWAIAAGAALAGIAVTALLLRGK